MVVSDPDLPARLSSPDPETTICWPWPSERVLLVSGDGDLLELPNQPAIVSPRDFLEVLERRS